MIHCIHPSSFASELTLPPQRILGFKDVTLMSSGFLHFNDVDSAAKDKSFDVLQVPLAEANAGDEVKTNRQKPKRPLSAYNWFFQSERQKMLTEMPIRKEGKPRRSHGKIGFADLARSIAAKWKDLSKEDRVIFDEKAVIDKKRYSREMEEWKKSQSLIVSQQPVPFADIFKNSTSLVSAPFDATLVRQQSFIYRDSLDAVPPPESILRNEMKMSSRDFFSTESFSLADAISAQFPQHLQLISPNSSQPAATLLPAGRVSPNIVALAQQLGDETTDLFLELFRDS